jgi:ribosome recycling factor
LSEVEVMKELIFEELRDGMEKALQVLEKSFSKVRTGRASLSLLDGIRVEYYGTPTPLNQVASLSIPESRLIIISPWDSSVLVAIEKAIQKSDLGMMPSNDGKLIRLSIPVLTEERRKDLVKVVRKMAEETKIKERNARRDANEQFKALKKDNEISEDELYNLQDEVQKMTDRYIDKTDKLLSAKEREIMEKRGASGSPFCFDPA